MPRKKIFETWSAALHIYNSVFWRRCCEEQQRSSECCTTIRRVVNSIAAGHGLLAWTFLLLDEENNRNNDIEQHPCHHSLNSVSMCKCPPLATLIHSSMIQHFAHLESRFEYVEGRLELLVLHPACLLASVHG